MKKPGRKGTKNTSYFSHEYIIANHGDIVSFVAMIIVIGLMFKITAPLSSLFIVMSHSINANESSKPDIVMYGTGFYDILAIFFYTLICIVIHAVIQEYILDKLNRKFHLSKVKFSKFNESGQLCVFYIISSFWVGNLIFSDKLISSFSSLWEDYPHIGLPFWAKILFIIQISYWIHQFPELYFQKIKREEIGARVVYSCLYLLGVGLAYSLNFTRLGLALMMIHFPVEALFHIARLVFFTGKTTISNVLFILWYILFVLARIVSATIAYIIFFRGLEKQSVDRVVISDGNFNTRFIRLNCFLLVISIQGFMMWNFINFHLRRFREKKLNQFSSVNFVTNSDLNALRSKKIKSKKDDEDLSELPEVDQYHQKELRQKKKTK